MRFNYLVLEKIQTEINRAARLNQLVRYLIGGITEINSIKKKVLRLRRITALNKKIHVAIKRVNLFNQLLA